MLEASIEKTRCDLTSQNEKEKKRGKKSDSGAVKSIAGYQENQRNQNTKKGMSWNELSGKNDKCSQEI